MICALPCTPFLKSHQGLTAWRSDSFLSAPGEQLASVVPSPQFCANSGARFALLFVDMDQIAREPVRLITLSREYGAGGSELGMLLGAELGWPVLDRDLAHRIAERLRCKHTDVEALAEKAPSWLERIASAFTVVPSDAPILPEPSNTPDPDVLAGATKAVLLEAVR